MLPRSEVITVEQLTRLKINKYRHIKPDTELHFNSGFNVLLGKNGTGKTTLLDLISIVISSDFSSLRGEEFDLEYELELPQLSMAVKVRNLRGSREPDTLNPFKSAPEMVWSIEARVHLKEENKRYHVTINQQESTAQDEVHEQEPHHTPTNDSLFNKGFSVGSRLLSPLVSALSGRQAFWDANSSFVISWFRLCRFDEALEVFELILGHPSTKLRRQPSPFIPFFAPDDLPTTFFPQLSFHPQDISDAIKKALDIDHTQTTHELTEKQVNFLADFVKLVGVFSAKVTITLDQKIPEEKLYKFKIEKFTFEYADGRYLTHERLSYGQKRLLAFLYYLAANEKFVIADELTDSFHHSWIEFCMGELGTRQCFLSSQNPILLDYLPIGSEEDAKKTFIQCRLEPNGNKEQMVWRNLSDEEAESFYKDLSVGIQSVSEVLMFRGLW